MLARNPLSLISLIAWLKTKNPAAVLDRGLGDADDFSDLFHRSTRKPRR